MKPGHRTDFSERSQKNIGTLFKFAELSTKTPGAKSFMDAINDLFGAPTLVYLTLNKGFINYSVLD